MCEFATLHTPPSAPPAPINNAAEARHRNASSSVYSIKSCPWQLTTNHFHSPGLIPADTEGPPVLGSIVTISAVGSNLPIDGHRAALVNPHEGSLCWSVKVTSPTGRVTETSRQDCLSVTRPALSSPSHGTNPLANC